MKPFRTTSSVSKSNRPTTRTAFLLAVLLIPVVPFRSVKANLLPPSNLTLTIQIIENGAVYTEPVKLWLRCGYNYQTVVDITCEGRCGIVIPYRYKGHSCDLLVTPEGRLPFILGGWSVNYRSWMDPFGGYDQSTHRASIDIGDRSCSLWPSNDSHFSISSCSTGSLTYSAVQYWVSQLPILFFLSYLLTIGLEFCVLLPQIKHYRPGPEPSLRRIFLAVAAVTLVTLPLVWFMVSVLASVSSDWYAPAVLLAELTAIGIEAAWYRKVFALGLREAVVLSAVANAVSCIVGSLLLGF